MANDEKNHKDFTERNFRSTYYGKVGLGSVEEKKSLEILLKEKPMDKVKLKQFCLRFFVPHTYRNIVWKLLLDVIPPNLECQNFIMDLRHQEYRMLLNALHVMRAIDSATPKEQIFYGMWLLQTGQLHFYKNLNVENNFTLIIRSFIQFFDDDIDIYWLSKCFIEHTRKFKNDYPKLVDCTWHLLEREDADLFQHLQKNKIKFPLEKWFDSCFAEIFNEMALGKVWDKFCGGSYKILVFVVVMLLINERHKLFKCTELGPAIDCLKDIPEETAEVIANQAIDKWQQHGSPLTVHDKPKPQ